MTLDSLFSGFHDGTLGSGTAILEGIAAAVAGFIAVLLVLRPLWLLLLSRHHDPKMSLERRRRAMFSANLAAVSLGVWVALHGTTLASLRSGKLGYQVSLLVLFVLAGFVAADLFLAIFADFVPGRRGRPPTSQFFKDVVRACAVLAIAAFGVKRAFPTADLGQLLATSAVLSLVLGLALQESLSNIFSGLMLTIDEPYKPGDWIEIDGKEARVLDSNWRSVRVVTRDDDVIYIPNRTMAVSTVMNFSRPTPLHRLRRRIPIDHAAPPNKVRQALLTVITHVEGVLADPVPEVFVLEYAEFSVTYEMRFWINDHAARTRIESDVMRGVWYQLRRNGIRIAIPIRDVYLKREKPQVGSEELLGLLRKVDFLAPVEDAGHRILEEEITTQLFAKDEVVCRQGDEGSTFYIIKSGQVSVSVHGQEGSGDTSVTADVARLGPGAYFGEMSLLTGTPRSSTVTALEDCELLCLDRETFGVLLRDNPSIAKHMSEILAARQSQTQEKLATESATKSFAAKPVEGSGRDILDKIKAIFRFR